MTMSSGWCRSTLLCRIMDSYGWLADVCGIRISIAVRDKKKKHIIILPLGGRAEWRIVYNTAHKYASRTASKNINESVSVTVFHKLHCPFFLFFALNRLDQQSVRPMLLTCMITTQRT